MLYKLLSRTLSPASLSLHRPHANLSCLAWEKAGKCSVFNYKVKGLDSVSIQDLFNSKFYEVIKRKAYGLENYVL